MPLRRPRAQARDTHDVDPEDFPTPGYATPPTEELFGYDETGAPRVPITLDGEEVCVAPEPPRELATRMFQVPISPDIVQILFDDPRRASATIVSLDNDLLLGVNRGDATAQWPVGVPLVTTASGELWARAVGASTNVTVVTELRSR